MQNDGESDPESVVASNFTAINFRQYFCIFKKSWHLLHHKNYEFFCSKKLIWSLLHACADADLCRGTSLAPPSLATTSSQLNPNKILNQWIDPQLLSISLKLPITQLWTHTQLMCMFLTQKSIQKAAGAGLAEVFLWGIAGASPILGIT